jgi:RNase P subunit RPR2
MTFILILCFPFVFIAASAYLLYFGLTARLRSIAKSTTCEHCGHILGVKAIELANEELTRSWAAIRAKNPSARMLTKRSVWAICPSCRATYDYNHVKKKFSRTTDEMAT